MGDYNRVQSYIKSHVLPKLDSLPQDVQSVQNAFDAWKADWTTSRAIKLDNLDAAISSRASSQQADTTIQRLTTLDDRVGQVEQGVGKMQVAMDYLNHGVLKCVSVAEAPTSGGNNVIVDIAGKGKLIAVFVRSARNAYDRKVTAEIDGNNVVMNVGEYAGTLVASSAFTERGNSLEIGTINTQGTKKTSFNVSSLVNRVEGKRLFAENIEIAKAAFQLYSSTVFGQKEPYQFYNNLKVSVDYGANVGEDTSTIDVLYLLDE